MRIFIAFSCQKKVTHILDEFAKQFTQSVLGTFTKQYHCTLAFLGEIDEQRIIEVHSYLSEIRFPRFRCTLSCFGAFGTPPTILYASIASLELMNLQKIIAQDLMITKQEFVPHVTIVRIKEIKDSTLFKEHLALQMPQFHFDVDEISLYKSTSTEQGTLYEPLHTYLLEQPSKKIDKDFRLPPL